MFHVNSLNPHKNYIRQVILFPLSDNEAIEHYKSFILFVMEAGQE